MNTDWFVVHSIGNARLPLEARNLLPDFYFFIVAGKSVFVFVYVCPCESFATVIEVLAYACKKVSHHRTITLGSNSDHPAVVAFKELWPKFLLSGLPWVRNVPRCWRKFCSKISSLLLVVGFKKILYAVRLLSEPHS